jgi:hypothetical protein
VSDVEVRMVQQMSGSRGDGQPWPEVGATLTVSPAEAASLIGASIAIPVVREETRTETGDAPEPARTETRGPGRPPKAQATAASETKTK